MNNKNKTGMNNQQSAVPNRAHTEMKNSQNNKSNKQNNSQNNTSSCKNNAKNQSNSSNQVK